MTVAYCDFVNAFPEFRDARRFPKGQVDFWLGQAPLQLNARRFGGLMDMATMLFVAHNLVLNAQNVLAAKKGIPGGQFSPVQSKSVGDISVSYDTNNTALEGAGAWNSSSYGQRLYTMIRAVGTGPLYRTPPSRSLPF